MQNGLNCRYHDVENTRASAGHCSDSLSNLDIPITVPYPSAARHDRLMKAYSSTVLESALAARGQAIPVISDLVGCGFRGLLFFGRLGAWTCLQYWIRESLCRDLRTVANLSVGCLRLTPNS